jgi:ankyrin repeat protein
VATAEPEIFAKMYRADSAESFLKEALPDLSVRGMNGQSLLHSAMAFRKQDIALALIGHGADVNAVTRKNETPLHHAIVYRNVEVALALLAQAARVDIADVFGNEALWPAVLNARGDDTVVEALLKHGADPHHKNKSGLSPQEGPIYENGAAAKQ